MIKIILITAIILAYPLIVGFVLSAISRFTHRKLALFLGIGLAAAILGYGFWMLHACWSAPVVFIEPTPEEAARGGVGRMDADCDGPVGFYIHLFGFFVGPALALVTLIPTALVWMRSKK